MKTKQATNQTIQANPSFPYLERGYTRLRHWTTKHNSSRTRPAKMSRTKVKLNANLSILRNP